MERPGPAPSGRGLGRLGPLLHPDVRTASGSTARRSRCATRPGVSLRPGPGDSTTLPAAAAGRLGAKQAQYVVSTSSLDYCWANRERDALRPGGELSARRATPTSDCVRPARRLRVRRGPQLDERVPEGVRDPVRRRAALGRRGQAARGMDAAATGSRWTRCARTRPSNGEEVPEGLVRRLDGSGPARARRHGAEHRPGRLRPDQHPLRASRGLEPRLPVGRRRRRDPAGRRSSRR